MSRSYGSSSREERQVRDSYNSSRQTGQTATMADNSVRPIVASRSVIINRTTADPLGRSFKSERAIRSAMFPLAMAGSFGGVGAIKDTRDREKRDMQDLNERLANYVEKVRFLEAQNRKLSSELEKLKTKWGQETSKIKSMYQAELDEARKLLDGAIKDKARLEIKMAAVEEYVEELNKRLENSNQTIGNWKEKLDRSNQQLSDYEAEISQMRRKVDGYEVERENDKKLIQNLQELLTRARVDLDNESLSHVDAESRRQSLEEEMEFMKAVHEQEMKEMAALVNKDNTAENRAFWKSEMGLALKEIQQMYDGKLDAMRAEIETSYNTKVQEYKNGATRNSIESSSAKEEAKKLKSHMGDLRDKLAQLELQNGNLQRDMDLLRQEKERREHDLDIENDQLRNNVVKLRAEMDAIMREFQGILDSKLGMELEIAAYRKLLEGEESRFSSKNNERESKVPPPGVVTKEEMSAKTTFQRSAKGSVSITECSVDAKYITLENHGRKDESCGSWVISRNVDGTERVKYTLDANFGIKAGEKTRIWVKGAKPVNAPSTDIEAETVDNWHLGANIITKLINTEGDERAQHVQKTVYTVVQS